MLDWIIGLVFLLLGLVAHIVGFSSPYWVVIEGVDFGLWQMCAAGGEGCLSLLMIEGNLSGWFHAVQALALSGMLAAILALFTSLVYMKTLSRSLTLAPGLLAFIAGILVGTGALIYAYKQWSLDVSLGWCYFTECGSAAAMLVSSLVFLIAAGLSRRKSRVVTFPTIQMSSDHVSQPTTEL